MEQGNQLHTCSAVNCKEKFESVNGTSAHARLHLHARKVHNTLISFACHPACEYAKKKRTSRR
jgi:hypothetical protein